MRYLVALITVLLLHTSAFALELTDKNVQQWMASYKSVMEWSKSQDKKALDFMDKDKTPDMSSLFTSAMQDMKSHKIYGEFTGVLKQNGYKDPQEWAQLGDRIMAATVAIEMEKHSANAQQTKAQMQQAMQMMENNPNMTPEQKAQITKMMGMSNQMMEVAAKVPQADKDVVKRNGDLVKTIMENRTPKTN